MISVKYYRVPEGKSRRKGKVEWADVGPYSRRYGFSGLDGEKPAQNGGLTTVLLETGRTIIGGTAACAPTDKFEYAEGRRVAALRLIAEVMRRQGIAEEDITDLLDMVTTGQKVNY